MPSLASPETGLGGMTGQAAGLVGAAATCRYLLSRSCPDAIDRCAGRRSPGSWSLANPSFDLARHAGGCSVFRIFADLGSHPYPFQRGRGRYLAHRADSAHPVFHKRFETAASSDVPRSNPMLTVRWQRAR